MRPLLSVVIPTRDRRRSVIAAIASVLDQSGDEIEVVVVDDGSSDGTGDELGRVLDARLRVLRTEGVGAAAARNIGAADATGGAVTFVDSDDVVLPGWAAFYVSALAAGDTDIVTCAAIETANGSGDRIIAPRPLGPAFGSLEALFLPGTYAVRAELFRDVGGFDPAMPAVQHTELALRLVGWRPQMRVTVTRTPLVEIDRRDGRRGIRTDDRAVYEGSVRLLALHGPTLRRDRRYYGDQAATAAYRALRLGRYRDSVRWYAESLRFNPRPRRAARLAHAAGLAVVHARRPSR